MKRKKEKNIKTLQDEIKMARPDIKKLQSENSDLTEKNKLLEKRILRETLEKKKKSTKKTTTDKKRKVLLDAHATNVAALKEDAKSLKTANTKLTRTNKEIKSLDKKVHKFLDGEIKASEKKNKTLKVKASRAAKIAAHRLDKKDKEIERLHKELMTYTFISSHDLQEPLRHLQVIASVLKEKEAGNLSAQGKEYLERMQRAAKRIQNLIHDLIEYANTNNTVVTLESTDLNDILKEVKKEFSDTIKEQKILIRSTKLDTLNVIPFQFKKLFKEIIGNSIKFSPRDKKLKVHVSSEIIKGSALKNTLLPVRKKFCHLYFKDNGIGFDPKFNDRIFEVFQKLHGKDHPGSGIGLATCKKIVENYGGKISAEGLTDVGATIDIYIPVEKDKKITA